MEALTLLLIVVLIWSGIVWLKRYAPLTSIIPDLFGSTAAAMERSAASERRANGVAQTEEPERSGITTSLAPPSEADTGVEVRPDQRVEMAARKWAASTFPGERIDTPTEPKPFMVLTQEPQARTPLAAEEIGELRIKPATTDQALPVRQAEPEGISSSRIEFSQINRATRRAVGAWQLPAIFRKRTGEPPDWEALIGGSWLNIIGIVIFVVGMALLAQHSVRQFGPLGKIATGVVASIAFVGCGALLERAERYRLIAWTLVGGGWALLYFTAYAAYNIAASRIIADPAIGLLVLSVVASGMIVHSLKYRSQLVTGLAYGLGFLAVAMTPLNAYTLAASAMLAGSQIALLRFLGWHYLALIAVAGTYLNHARWLGEVIATRPDFWLSQGILAFYWVLFVIVGLVRRPKSGQESLIHLTINVANAIGLLGLSAWQIWVLHGENLHYLTASAMLAYVVAAGVSMISNRPDLLRFNGSVAVLLFALTLPLALGPLDISRDWLAIYWVVGGVLTVACGYLLREVLLRLEGYALCGVACLAVFSFNLGAVLSFADWHRPHWWIAPTVAVILLGVSGLLQRVAGREGVLPGADQLGRAYGYAATAIVAAFLWRISDPYVVCLSWLAVGLVFFEVGAGWPRPLLRNQAYVLFGLAFAALLAINLYEIYPASAGLAGAGLLPRSVIVSLSAAVYYYLFWRLRRERCGFAQSAAEPAVADVFSIAGSTLLAALAWKELDPALVALAWISVGLVLLEVGARWPRPLLRNQAYVLFGLAFAALLAINLYEIYPASAGLAGAGLLPRSVIVSLSAAVYYYLFWRLRRERCGFAQTAAEPAIADVFSIAGSTLLAALAWKELDPALVALAWISVGLVLFEVGAARPRPLLRNQAYVLFGLAFAALLGINLYEIYPASAGLSPAPGLLPRSVIVSLSAAVYYYLFWRLRRQQCGFAQSAAEPAIADVSSIAGSVLLAALAWKELDPALVALAWISVGLVLFEVGAGWPRPLLRNQAYVLFGLAFAALLAINLYEIHPASAGLAGAGLLPRSVIVGLSAAAYYYLFWRLRRERCGFAQTPTEPGLADLFSIVGSTLLAALAWKELDPDIVALGWVALGAALFEVGARWPRPLLRNQAYVLFGLGFTALLAINLYEIFPPAPSTSSLPRWFTVGVSAIAIYRVFWQLHPEGRYFVRTEVDAALADYTSIAGTVLFTILAWKELDSVTVALAWGLFALILFEVGHSTPFTRITPQAHALAGLTFGRLFMANFVALGETMGISHRLLTVIPLIALFYYFYSQTTALPSYRLFSKDLRISRLYSWGAAIVLLALMRFELGRAYAVIGIAPLFVALVILGRYLNNNDFRLQAYLLAILTFGRCWATNAYLVAEIYGIPERIVTMLPVVVAFASATAICMRPTDVRYTNGGNIFARSLSLVDANPHRFFALLGSALMALLFYYELPVGWVTLAFSIEALILILAGLATEERSFRIYGLGLLLIAVLKLIIIDASGVDPIYRILSYIGLGLILLIASMVYTRYRSVIEKYV